MVPGGSAGEEFASPAMQETRFDPWLGKIPVKKGMATHFSILVWKTPWTKEPGGLLFMGSQRVTHMTEGLTLSLSFNLCCLEYVMLQGKRNFTDTIKFIKFKIRRSSSVLQIGPIYSTESVTAKRCLSSWVLRDSVEMREAGERFKS